MCVGSDMDSMFFVHPVDDITVAQALGEKHHHILEWWCNVCQYLYCMHDVCDPDHELSSWFMQSAKIKLICAGLCMHGKTSILWCEFNNYRIFGPSKIIMLILALLGFIVFDLVYITALINYAAQSELIISLIKVVHTSILQRRYHTFDEALKVST